MSEKVNRRELLKPLAAVALTPLLVKGEEVGKSVAIEPKTKYVIFVNGDLVDPSELVDWLAGSFPGGTPIYAVFPTRHQTVDDAIRIFKVE